MRPSDKLERLLTTSRRSGDEIVARTRSIYEDFLCEAPNVDRGNFECLGGGDLEVLFRMYDSAFFEGCLAEAVQHDGLASLGLRVSSRMTSAGGKTGRTRRKVRMGGALVEMTRYEIAISGILLFRTLAEVDREILVNGVRCSDRVEALQRVFEHELLHLAELLLRGRSSCRAALFQDAAKRLFGHTEVTHRLVTQQERAAHSFDLRAGDRVAFEHDGER